VQSPRAIAILSFAVMMQLQRWPTWRKN